MSNSQRNNRLPVLAAEINKAHEAARKAAHKSLRHAIEAGDRLLEAKAACGHGEWLPWLRDHCQVSERTAQAYMRLARNREAVTESAAVADLTINGVMELLSRTIEPVGFEPLPTPGWSKLGVIVRRGHKEFLFIMPDWRDTEFYRVSHSFYRDREFYSVAGFKKPIRGDAVGAAIRALKDNSREQAKQFPFLALHKVKHLEWFECDHVAVQNELDELCRELARAEAAP